MNRALSGRLQRAAYRGGGSARMRRFARLVRRLARKREGQRHRYRFTVAYTKGRPDDGRVFIVALPHHPTPTMGEAIRLYRHFPATAHDDDVGVYFRRKD